MSAASTLAESFRWQQTRLVGVFEQYDGEGRFGEREWDRSGLGGGRARILENGAVFERAGINVSLVSGERAPDAIGDADLAGRPFQATGISMVVHPWNPYAPSFHANFRYFEVDGAYWRFGGGMDLTPSYGFAGDAVHFHETLRNWCDRHGDADYQAWKGECDRYFQLPHRGEMRGIGGVFFSDLTSSAVDGFERCRRAVFDGIATVTAAYLPILDRRCRTRYGERQRAWQLIRRSRYVEFNLLCDRGTQFGLQSGGDTEAILMSMPPLVSWSSWTQKDFAGEAAALKDFLRPADWVGASCGDGESTACENAPPARAVLPPGACPAWPRSERDARDHRCR